jgi:hypothetical protein
MSRDVSAKKTFLLLFRNTGPEVFAPLSSSQRQQLMMRWNDWYDRLAVAGKATEGQPLEAETRVVSGPGGSRIIDGPFAESKEAVGGYVKVHVETLEEATQIAQAHPALEHGMLIEVRELCDNCHLGVSAHHTSQKPAMA